MRGSRSEGRGSCSASAPSAGDPVVGVVALDRQGRVVDAEAGIREVLANTPDLERALAHAARAEAHRSGWSEHGVRLPDRTLRIRLLVDSTRGDVVAFVAEEERARALDLAALSPREREVARLVGSGASDAQAARRLKIAVATVRWHLTNIYRKATVRDRSALQAAVAQAQRGRRAEAQGGQPRASGVASAGR